MYIHDLLAPIEALAPLTRAANWDNCGLQVGSPDETLTGVLVAVNPSRLALQTAIARGANLLVTHHPLLFKAVKVLDTRTDPGRSAALAIKNGITVYAAHTNLDVVACNHHLSRLLGFPLDRPLSVMGHDPAGTPFGIGLWGELPESMAVSEILDRVKQAISPRSLRLVGDSARRVRRIAICSGSGGDLVDDALAQGVECFITGELRYHTALDCLDRGLAVIEAGHQATEQPVVDFLVEALRPHLPASIPISGFSELEPFEVIQ